ncbi:hypothetical protein [Pleomorphovibrio marinus]|uniref:hypothetical protein n=1 Tax=Pleomorphovibrio marinus TaxID=2164132 RepID=UPI000E0A91B7|nr:hypothetical protein [Pleomorphovibrio marinus]
MQLPILSLYSIVLVTTLLIIPPPSLAQDAISLSHRDDFKMNSISGGNFRDYISEHVKESDTWAISLRKFGTYHNLMHEWMSEWARYYREEEGMDELVPDFEERISGGQWTSLREAMEEAEEEKWMDFVQVVEVMHDRVHQAMLYAVIYDMEKYQRDLDISKYADDDRMPHAIATTLPSLRKSENWEGVVEDFRNRAWHSDKNGPHHHAAWQLMMVFEEMTQDLIHLWAIAAQETFTDGDCSPEEASPKVVDEGWREYALTAQACTDEPWKAFVHTTVLMHARIHHVMEILHAKES